MTGVLLLAAAIFVLGGVVILAASLLPGGGARDLWPFYRSEFLIVGAILLPSAANGWIFLAVLLALTLRGQWELFTLFGQPVKSLLGVAAMLAGAGLVVAGMFALPRLPVAAVAAIILLFLLGRLDMLRARPAIVSLVFPVLAVALMGALRQTPQGFLWLLLAQAAVETNDLLRPAGAGKLDGPHTDFSRLSPGKTLAGLVGGLAAGLAAGLAVAHFLLGLSAVAAAFLATAVALAAGLPATFCCPR